jgi:hypothetical protein
MKSVKPMLLVLALLLAACIPRPVSDSPGTTVRLLEAGLAEVVAERGPTVVIGSATRITKWEGPCSRQPTPLDDLIPKETSNEVVTLAIACDAPGRIKVWSQGPLTPRITNTPRAK